MQQAMGQPAHTSSGFSDNRGMSIGGAQHAIHVLRNEALM